MPRCRCTAGKYVPHVGDQPIKAIRPTMVSAWVQELEGEGLSPGSIRGMYHVATQVFAAGVDDRGTIRAERQCDQAGRIRPPKSRTHPAHGAVRQVLIDALAAHLAAYPNRGGR